MQLRGSAYALVVFLALLIYGKSERVCTDVSLGSKVKVRCVERKRFRNTAKNVDIVWKTKLEQEDDWTILSDSNATTVNNCRNSTQGDCRGRNLLSVLTIRNFTSPGVVLYSCFSLENVKVYGTKLSAECPLQANIQTHHGCLYHAKTEKLICCWELAATQAGYENFTMSTTYLDLQEKKVTDRTTCDELLCCERNQTLETIHENHYIFLSATNGDRTASSATNSVLPSNHIKPSSPNISKIDATKEKDVLGILVRWTEPGDSVYIRDYVYRIRYRENGGVARWNVTGILSNRYYTIKDDGRLQPNSNYDIEIAAKPGGGFYGGIWSDWSTSETVRTLLQAPRKKFNFSQSSLIKLHLNDTTYNVITLRWIRYDNTNEDGFVNKVSCRDQQGEKFYEIEDETSLIFKTTSEEITCSGKFCNKEGCSQENHIFQNLTKEPDHFPKPPTNVSVNKSFLQFNFEPGDSQRLHVKICSRFRYSNSEREELLDPFSACVIKGFEADFRELLNASRNAAKIPHKWDPCRQYIIILESNSNSNIVWKSIPSQMAQYDPNLEEATAFTLADSSSSSDPKITVTWTKVIDNEFMNRQLQYQPVGGSECENDDGLACYEVFFHNISPRDANHIKLMKNIFGSTEYKVKERLVCTNDLSKGDDEKNHPFSLQAPFDVKAIKTSTTKPGKPGQPERMSDNDPTPLMRWKVPLHKNGPKTSYELIKYDEHQQELSRLKTDQNQQIVDIACNEHNNNTFSFVVTAINYVESGDLRSSSDTLKDIPCIVSKGGYNTSKVAATVVLVIVFTSVVVSMIVLFFCRKRIKRKLKIKFSTPAPVIDNSIIDKDTVQYKSDQLKGVEQESYNSVITAANCDEMPDSVCAVEKASNVGIESPSTYPRACPLELHQDEAEDTIPTEYVTEAAALGTVCCSSRTRTVSTASSALTSVSNGGIEQYVQVAELPTELPCDGGSTPNQQSTESSVNNCSSDPASLVNANSNSCESIKYANIQQSPSYVAAVAISESDKLACHESSEDEHSCPVDELSYICPCLETSKQNIQDSTESLARQVPFRRQSSSSSGIIADYNECEESMKAGMKNLLSTCLPSTLMSTSNAVMDVDEDEDECRMYDIDDIEHDALTVADGYVDFESAALLSKNV